MIYLEQMEKDELLNLIKRLRVNKRTLEARIEELEARLAISKQEWILVSDRLPELVFRDDTPREVYGKAIPPSLSTQTVIVSVYGDRVRTDRWHCVEGSPGWWSIYNEQVRAWMPLPEALK